MSISRAAEDARATSVRVGRDYLEVVLTDARVIRVPISWFPRLAAASQGQRRAWRLIGRGVGIRWDALDEDISVQGLLQS